MVDLASTSTHHSSSASEAFGFDFCWNACKFLSGDLEQGDGMEGVARLWDYCKTLPMPSCMTPTDVVNNGWPCFHLTHHFSSTNASFSDLPCARMLTRSWVLIAQCYGMEGIVMLWDYFETALYPSYKLAETCIPMVVIASASNHPHSSSTSGSLRFGLCWLARHLPGGFLHMLMAWKVLWCHESVLKLYYMNSPSGMGKNNV